MNIYHSNSDKSESRKILKESCSPNSSDLNVNGSMVATSNGSSSIIIVNTKNLKATTTKVPLSSGFRIGSGPDWSPSGKWLAVSTMDTVSPRPIYIMDLYGNGLTLVGQQTRPSNGNPPAIFW